MNQKRILKKINQNTKGFTLVELLISIAIFVIFMGVVVGSYASIVKTQRDANEYRELYSEARSVFEVTSTLLRDNLVDYLNPKYILDDRGIIPVNRQGLSEIYLVSKEGKDFKHLLYDREEETLKLSESVGFPLGSYENLNGSGVKITNFAFYVSPVVDPYNPQNINLVINQFQPKVTVFATFEKELTNGTTYSFDLQTTISSRAFAPAQRLNEF